jgi:hypothetical protein
LFQVFNPTAKAVEVRFQIANPLGNWDGPGRLRAVQREGLGLRGEVAARLSTVSSSKSIAANRRSFDDDLGARLRQHCEALRALPSAHEAERNRIVSHPSTERRLVTAEFDPSDALRRRLRTVAPPQLRDPERRR